MELQSLASSSIAARQGGEPLREPFTAQDVVLRHLQTPAEIATVLHLREEIDLSVHAAAGSQFAALEKKETTAASSSGLT